MNLVRHDGHVDGIPAVRIGGPGIVTGHALLQLESGAAMERQVLMTVIAQLDVGDLPREQPGCCIIGRPEVINRVADRREAANLKADSVGQCRHIADRHGVGHIGNVEGESVGVRPVIVIDQRARGTVLGNGLNLRLGARPHAGLLDLIDVTLPGAGVAVGARHQFCNIEADGAGWEVLDRIAVAVAQTKTDYRRAGNDDLLDNRIYLCRIGDIHTGGRARRPRCAVVTVARREHDRRAHDHGGDEFPEAC